MGQLIYEDSPFATKFDDRALVHLQLVIGAKLRRHESFFFTWTNDIERGGGRESIWLDNAIALCFVYPTGARHAINREWLELLTKSANSAMGLQFIAEPIEPTSPPGVEVDAHVANGQGKRPRETDRGKSPRSITSVTNRS